MTVVSLRVKMWVTFAGLKW